MSEQFDPYYKWLSIPPKDQPPNHYRLLGVELFEDDPEVIDAAANRQMEFLQGLSAGPHAAQSQAVLNEIAAARLCLLDPGKKASYDRELRAKQAAAGPPAAPPPAPRRRRAKRPADAPPPPLAPPRVEVRIDSGESASPTHRVRQRQSPWPLAGAVALSLIVVAAVVFFAIDFGGPDESNPPGGPTASGLGKQSNGKKPTHSHTAAGKQKPQAGMKSTLLDLADQAIKARQAEEAINWLEAYLAEPNAPQYAEMKVKLQKLKDITKDEFALQFLEERTEAELTALEGGAEPETDLAPELHPIFVETLRKNIPEERRRRDPVKLLAGKGLRQQGSLWLLDETAVPVDLKPLAGLEKAYQTAAARVDRLLKPLAKASDDELLKNADLHVAIKDKIKARNDLALAWLSQKKKLGKVEKAYDGLAKDAQVAAALKRLSGKTKSPQRLGPSGQLDSSRKQLADFAPIVLTDKVPYYFSFFNGPAPTFSVILNDTVAAEVTVRNDAGFNNLIPEAVIKQAGIQVDPDGLVGKLTETINGKAREFICPRVVVPSLRIGLHVVENVEFMVMPKEALSPASVGTSVLGRFQIDLNRQRLEATLTMKKPAFGATP